jgi:hypothetical protein
MSTIGNIFNGLFEMFSCEFVPFSDTTRRASSGPLRAEQKERGSQGVALPDSTFHTR